MWNAAFIHWFDFESMNKIYKTHVIYSKMTHFISIISIVYVVLVLQMKRFYFQFITLFYRHASKLNRSTNKQTRALQNLLELNECRKKTWTKIIVAEYWVFFTNTIVVMSGVYNKNSFNCTIFSTTFLLFSPTVISIRHVIA